tara:strand:- start:384 stop:653 length:270 start_codon:yes stop_codon:yes gene_type:complete
MVICSFCKNNYEYPRGTTVVGRDGTARYFCSSKCKKNSEMGRINKKVKWVRKSDIIKDEKARREATYKAKQEAKSEEKVVKKKVKKKKA